MKRVCEAVNAWILEEDLAPRAGLKVIRKFDGLYPEDEEEREAYWDFIGWFLDRDWAPLMDVPVQERGGWFPPVQVEEIDGRYADVSHFNTMDFVRQTSFSKRVVDWRHREVLKRVRFLALTYSVVSDEEGRKRTFARYRNLVEKEYRDEAVVISYHLRRHGVWMDKERAAERIRALNHKIRDCKKAWSEVIQGD